MNTLDQEYLKRELVTEANFHINHNTIKVDCPHTCWANIKRIENKITKESILELYSKVYKHAKNNNITIGRKNGYKKFITDNWQEYEQEIKYYNKVFDETIEQFKEVEKRGIHSGTRDDIVLSNAMNKRNEYMTVYYRTSIYDRMNSIYRSLEKLYKDMQQYEYTKIVL